MRPLLAGLLGLLVVTLAGRADANAPAPFVRRGGNEGGAFVAQATSLVVEHEELTFRCDKGVCDFKAVYHVLNPTDAREEVLGAFYGIMTDRFEAQADGTDARRTLTGEQLKTIDEAVTALDPEVTRDDDGLTRQGFGLAVDAHAKATLVFTGRMSPVTFDTTAGGMHEWDLPTLWTRHPWLSSTERDDATDEFAYALSPIRGWAGSPNIDITIRCPDTRCWPDGQTDWAVGEEGDDLVARKTVAARDAGTLRFRIVRPGKIFMNGGPLVGVGARLGTPGVRARFGYEFAAPQWILYSAAVETNFKNTTTLVPLAELATPDLIFFIPSFGLGAGVPVELRPGNGPLVGGRLQLTVSFPILSMVLPVDFFPGTSDAWQAGLFGQASF